jgi:7-cyano-7-deazaguanine synthase
MYEKEDGPIGVLYSGGLDSSVLLGSLLRRERSVQPLYIRSGLAWQRDELRSARRFLRVLSHRSLRRLVVLSLPLDDVYMGHWSLTGQDVPDATTEDAAVFLPGRNALLIIKAAVWCQLHGIPEMALAPLETNPFADATTAFFNHLEAALNQGVHPPLRIVRPFDTLEKRDVLRLADGLPLEETFSCIAPRRGLHCGRCNKCAERQAAFRQAALPDPTQYDYEYSRSLAWQ